MSALPAWFHTFCSPGDRFSALTRALTEAFVPFDVVETAAFRHVQVRRDRPAAPANGEKILVAHYDRVAGTPGANDNGASVLALVDYVSRSRTRSALRVIFTDGEELAGQGGVEQGSFALARSWGVVKGLLPLVLDMTGIGDTLVLGHLAEHLVRQVKGQVSPLDAGESTRVRRAAKRFLSICGGTQINTPFSDDLGLLLAGFPSVQISLLPRGEVAAYRVRRAEPGELSGTASGALPPSWRAMHTADDRPETLWPESRALIAEVLAKFEALHW